MSDEECEHQASRNARLRSSLYEGRSLHNHDGLPMSSVLAQLQVCRHGYRANG